LVIVGGLIVSQLITLYVTPVIYLYSELFQEWVLEKFRFLRNPEEEILAAEGRMTQALAADSNGNGDH
jgi:hypothetical protein